MAVRTKYLPANVGVYAECRLSDNQRASVFLDLVNTVCTTSWPMGSEETCLERGNSVHTESQGSFIKLMFVCFDGRDKCSLLPFDVSSSVNITTVTNENTRELLASGYDVLQHIGFGKKGGRCNGFVNKNCNFSAVLHGVLNREEYIERLLTIRGLRFSRNAYFPPVKYSFTTETGQVVQVQIYPTSLAVNLQNLTKETVTRYGSFILQQIACEADIDTSLMRFCVDAEWRLDRTLSPYEKLQLVIGYYSFRWLEATVDTYDIVAEMHDFLLKALSLFTLDHGRYWYSFERKKRKNMEIYDLFIEDTPLRHCPHAGGFRAFVLTFLSSRGHAFAAQKIREAFPVDKDSATETDPNDPCSARLWYETHVVDRHCLFSRQ